MRNQRGRADWHQGPGEAGLVSSPLSLQTPPACQPGGRHPDDHQPPRRAPQLSIPPGFRNSHVSRKTQVELDKGRCAFGDAVDRWRWCGRSRWRASRRRRCCSPGARQWRAAAAARSRHVGGLDLQVLVRPGPGRLRIRPYHLAWPFTPGAGLCRAVDDGDRGGRAPPARGGPAHRSPARVGRCSTGVSGVSDSAARLHHVQGPASRGLPQEGDDGAPRPPMTGWRFPAGWPSIGIQPVRALRRSQAAFGAAIGAQMPGFPRLPCLSHRPSFLVLPALRTPPAVGTMPIAGGADRVPSRMRPRPRQDERIAQQAHPCSR